MSWFFGKSAKEKKAEEERRIFNAEHKEAQKRIQAKTEALKKEQWEKSPAGQLAAEHRDWQSRGNLSVANEGINALVKKEAKAKAEKNAWDAEEKRILNARAARLNAWKAQQQKQMEEEDARKEDAIARIREKEENYEAEINYIMNTEGVGRAKAEQVYKYDIDIYAIIATTGATIERAQEIYDEEEEENWNNNYHINRAERRLAAIRNIAKRGYGGSRKRKNKKSSKRKTYRRS
jgi:hypothetical protein